MDEWTVLLKEEIWLDALVDASLAGYDWYNGRTNKGRMNGCREGDWYSRNIYGYQL